jgi:hypothetical protein
MLFKRMKWLGPVIYLIAVITLFKIDISILIQPIPLLTVLGGGVILAFSRKRECSRWQDAFQTGILYAGALASLLMMLASAAKGLNAVAEGFVPGIYAGFIYLILHLYKDLNGAAMHTDAMHAGQSALPSDWDSERTATPFL